MLARFDDGVPALAEMVVGGGRVLLWTAGAANRWRQQVYDQLEAFRREVEEGFAPVGDPVVDLLEPRAETSFDLSLRGGAEYLIVGFCDEDCDDLDLHARYASGQSADADYEPDDYPVLRFQAPAKGSCRITVSMPGCSTSDCVFGVQVYAR